MSKPFSAYERAAFKKLLNVAHASQPDLGAAIGRLENGGSPLSRSYVSQVLGGGRGSDNMDVAERFRRGALALVGEFLKKSGPLTARGVQDFLHDLRRELSDEELADEQLKSLLVRLAGLSPEPPKSFYPPVGALPDDARNRVDTTALLDAVRHATSYPHFNLHVSGPRFSGTSTVLRAVEAAWKAHAPDGHVFWFDCAKHSLPFSAEFREMLKTDGQSSRVTEEEAKAAEERVQDTLGRLFENMSVDLALPEPAPHALPGRSPSMPRELLVAVRSQLKALESAKSDPHRRLIVLDGLDPTDVPLAKALCEVAVGLNDLRTGPRGISVAVGTSYSADFLGKLEPSPRSSSHWLSERFHQVPTRDYTPDEARSLAKILSDGNAALEARLIAEAAADLPGGQPLLLDEAMRFLLVEYQSAPPPSERLSLFDAMRSDRLRKDDAPKRVQSCLAEIERFNQALRVCDIAVDDNSLAKLKNNFALTLLRSAGWLVEREGKLGYRWQSLEEAWGHVKN